MSFTILNTKEYLRTIGTHIVIWTFAFVFFNFMREYGQSINHPSDEFVVFKGFDRIRFQLFVGLISGVIFGTFSYWFFKVFETRRFRLGSLITIATLAYFMVTIFFIMTSFYFLNIVFSVKISHEARHIFFESGQATVIIVYCFVVSFLIVFIKQVDQKFGPGVLKKMILGKYYTPKVENKIFMFLDMRSSTSIAEDLGHIAFSSLIQDCFEDIGVATKYGAEIYQYVGDEVILTWDAKIGIVENRCIEAFFAFQEVLKSRKIYYKNRYDLSPEFKAGLNIGEVSVAEVGKIKRQIAYHGDTINTAARIQAECNRYGKDILLSEKLTKCLNFTYNFHQPELMGSVLLRGKHDPVNIFAIN